MIGEIKKHPTHIGMPKTGEEKQIEKLRSDLESLNPDLTQCDKRLAIASRITECKRKLLEKGLYVKTGEGNASSKFNNID